MIEIREMSIGYGQKSIINNCSISIEKGERLAIIGPSGCGKTTLLYTIAGLLKPNKGSILIEGCEVSSGREGTAVILQDYGLLPWKNVWQNITLSLALKKKLNSEEEAYCEKLLGRLGIESHKEKYPCQLSGGQKQRVAIARAWSTRPDLLLMDEPFSSLDAMTREGLQEAMISFHQKREQTMVLVTHSIEEAVFMAQKILIMTHRGDIYYQLDNHEQGALDYRESNLYYERCKALRLLMKEVLDEI